MTLELRNENHVIRKRKMKNSLPARNGNLDAMRAIAVLLVVLAHLKIRNIPGGSGVTIFFVISGFIITREHLLSLEGHGPT